MFPTSSQINCPNFRVVPYYGNQNPPESEEMTRHYFWSAFWTFARVYRNIFDFSQNMPLGFGGSFDPRLFWVRE